MRALARASRMSAVLADETEKCVTHNTTASFTLLHSYTQSSQGGTSRQCIVQAPALMPGSS